MLKLSIRVVMADSGEVIFPKLEFFSNWVQGDDWLNCEDITWFHAIRELGVIYIVSLLPKCITGGGMCKSSPIPWPMK